MKRRVKAELLYTGFPGKARDEFYLYAIVFPDAYYIGITGRQSITQRIEGHKHNAQVARRLMTPGLRVTVECLGLYADKKSALQAEAEYINRFEGTGMLNLAGRKKKYDFRFNQLT